MEDDHLPEHINNLWEDMDRLNALYEELMWDHDVELEFKADYDNNQIIINLRNVKITAPLSGNPYYLNVAPKS